MRSALGWALLCAALAGCPLPQPLAAVERADGGTVAPPRILSDNVQPRDAIVPVARTCEGGAHFTLTAAVEDSRIDEVVEARWFIDYRPNVFDSRVWRAETLLPPDPDNLQTTRVLQPQRLDLPAWQPTEPPLHVVDLVVSNGFAPAGQEAPDLPNRGPAPGFETQVYRWVFQWVDTGGRCQ